MNTHHPQSSPSSPPLRVLIADDHEWIGLILLEVTRETLPGATIVETEDGAEALAASQSWGADLLVTNHNMPHLNGPTLIRELRRQAPALPIAMVSINPQAREEAMAAGANVFLLKEQIMEHLPRFLLGHAQPGK